MSRGRAQILDVDRVGNDRYRVRGVVQASYGGGYGGYERYDRYDRGYASYGRDDYTCVARGNGRITDFRL